MYKVGIVTLFGRFNYGNRLQNYAICSIFRKLGFEVETLVVIKPRFVESIVSFIRKATRGTVSPEALMTDRRLKAFDRFNSGMQIRTFQRFKSISMRDCNVVVCGSDQVWNLRELGSSKFWFKWFFLKFCSPVQRIALAPSLGVSALNTQELTLLKEGVRGFSSLSVREKQGAELILQASGRNAEVICDPTLLLSAEEWHAVANGDLTPQRAYVFTYLLGGMNEEANEALCHVVREEKAVVSLTDRQTKDELDAGPAEFISLIEHADHVITDSFHAAVFSIIFHRPLTIVHREGNTEMFSRLDNLSKVLGISEKVYGSEHFDYDRAGDYSGTDELIELQREIFMDYLIGCLEEKMPDWKEENRGQPA